MLDQNEMKSFVHFKDLISFFFFTVYEVTSLRIQNGASNYISGACQCPTGLAGSQCSLLKSLKPKILSDGVVVESISVSFTCLNVTTTGSSDGATCRIQVKSVSIKCLNPFPNDKFQIFPTESVADDKCRKNNNFSLW